MNSMGGSGVCIEVLRWDRAISVPNGWNHDIAGGLWTKTLPHVVEIFTK